MHGTRMIYLYSLSHLPFIHLAICPFIHLSVDLSSTNVCPSTHLTSHLGFFICLSIHLPTCLLPLHQPSIHLFIHLPAHPSVHPRIFLSSISLSICLSVHPYVHPAQASVALTRCQAFFQVLSSSEIQISL